MFGVGLREAPDRFNKGEQLLMAHVALLILSPAPRREDLLSEVCFKES
jgi:hypothetical protein